MIILDEFHGRNPNGVFGTRLWAKSRLRWTASRHEKHTINQKLSRNTVPEIFERFRFLVRTHHWNVLGELELFWAAFSTKAKSEWRGRVDKGRLIRNSPKLKDDPTRGSETLMPKNLDFTTKTEHSPPTELKMSLVHVRLQLSLRGCWKALLAQYSISSRLSSHLLDLNSPRQSENRSHVIFKWLQLQFL